MHYKTINHSRKENDDTKRIRQARLAAMYMGYEIDIRTYNDSKGNVVEYADCLSIQ